MQVLKAQHSVTVVDIRRPDLSTVCVRPLFLVPVTAGFPSPADDHVEDSLDLNRRLIKNRIATFFIRVDGDSMVDVGIFSGDTLVVDRSIEAKDGDIVVATINSEFTVKRLSISKKKVTLVAENENFPDIVVTEAMDFEVWGVVTNSIHSLHK